MDISLNNTEYMTEQENTTQELKFYSLPMIAAASYFGGPLAASYMIRENYIALQEEKKAKNALTIGIVFTVLLIIVLVLLPDKVVDRIPTFLIPMIYTGFIYYYAEKNQGEVLKKHKENQNKFHSVWRVVGLSIVSAILLVGGIFAATFLLPEEKVYTQYSNELAVFMENEKKTLVFYDHLDTASNRVLLHEIDAIALPMWKENIRILKEAATIEGLPTELKKHNEKLLAYSELRIQAFELFRRAISEDTEQYAPELNAIHEKIDLLLKELN